MNNEPRVEHESDQSRYASECDLCETDGHLHLYDCPNNPRCRHDGPIARDADGTEVCLACGEYAAGVSDEQ
jgi:hypothetical protein